MEDALDSAPDSDADDLSALIGSRIAQRRAALGLSLDEVAARPGVSRAMVSRIVPVIVTSPNRLSTSCRAKKGSRNMPEAF